MDIRGGQAYFDDKENRYAKLPNPMPTDSETILGYVTDVENKRAELHQHYWDESEGGDVGISKARENRYADLLTHLERREDLLQKVAAKVVSEQAGIQLETRAERISRVAEKFKDNVRLFFNTSEQY
jgi:hypothetical protein